MADEVGINLQLWTSVWARGDLPDRAVLRAFRQMGCDGVEVTFSGSRPADNAAYGRMVAGGGVAVALVNRRPDADPLSDDPAQPTSSDGYLRRLVDCADAIGAEVIVGCFYASPVVFAAQEINEQEWVWLVESQTDMDDYAPMRLAVKPLNRREAKRPFSVADAARLVRAVNRPNYGCLLDAYSARVDEVDPGAALDATLPKAGHVHVSLNHSRTPGSGEETTLRALHRLRLADYCPWINVDVFAGAAFARSIWTGPLSQQTELALDAIRTIRQTWKH